MATSDSFWKLLEAYEKHLGAAECFLEASGSFWKLLGASGSYWEKIVGREHMRQEVAMGRMKIPKVGGAIQVQGGIKVKIFI